MVDTSHEIQLEQSKIEKQPLRSFNKQKLPRSHHISLFTNNVKFGISKFLANDLKCKTYASSKIFTKFGSQFGYILLTSERNV
jgi:hypothetical protein